MSYQKEYDLEERLVNFALTIASIVDALPNTRFAALVGDQLLRSSTSAALNYGEAQAAESKRDFVHKVQVILKELRESSISLKLLQRRALITEPAAFKESKELVAIFTASVKTAKKSLKEQG